MLFKPKSGLDTYTAADVFEFTESELLELTSTNIISLDVLANDSGAVTLYSFDSGGDGTSGRLHNDDTDGAWENLSSGDRMRIVTGEDGVARIELDISYSLARFGASSIKELEDGERISVSFAYAVSLEGSDKPLAWTTVTFTLTGESLAVNHSALISGTAPDALSEDGAVDTLTGRLTIHDEDGPHEESFVRVDEFKTDYGTFSLSPEGAWTYVLRSEGNPYVQSLRTGQTVHDDIVVRSVDGTAYTLRIDIQGQDEPVVISGTLLGKVREDFEEAQVAEGMVTASWADGAVQFVQPTEMTQDYGSFTFDPHTGEWTYEVDDVRANALRDGQTVTDTMVVRTDVGGGSETITVTITGTNDVPEIDGTSFGASLQEDGPNLHAEGTVTANDPDDGESGFGAAEIVEQTHYGTFSFNFDTGLWQYDLDNARAQSLGQGVTGTESMRLYSVDGTNSVLVSVTVTGVNDRATIEADTSRAAGPDALTVSGTFTVRDVDKGEDFLVRAAPPDEGGGSEAVGEPSEAVVVEPVLLEATGTVVPRDPTPPKFDPTQPITILGRWGSFIFNNEAGTWSYTLDDRWLELSSGQQVTEFAHMQSLDGTAVAEFTVHVTGAISDTPATFSGHMGTVAFDLGQTSVSGKLTVIDSVGQDSLVLTGDTEERQGTYGMFGMTSSGKWGYTLDPEAPGIRELPEGATVTDTFRFHSVDGSPVDVVVTIVGADDWPVITTDGATTTIDEDAASPTLGGQLFISDPDVGESAQFAAADSGSLTGTFGSFSFDETTGVWRYTLASTPEQAAALDLLREGEQRFDNLRVSSTDRSASYELSVLVIGANDVAVFSGTSRLDLSEDDDVFMPVGYIWFDDADEGEAGIENPQFFGGTYGSFTIFPVAPDSAGPVPWSYRPYADDVAQAAIQGLRAGETREETATVTSRDGQTSQVLRVVIHGQDDVATIGDDGRTGTLVDGDAIQTTGGKLTVTDADAGDAFVRPLDDTSLIGSYGEFTLQPGGDWSYTLRPDWMLGVAPSPGAPLVDTLEVVSLDGSASATLTVSIESPVGAPRVGGTTSAHLFETATQGSVGGQLRLIGEPPADGEALFHVPGFGLPPGWSIDTFSGAWSFEVDMTAPEIQALNTGEWIDHTLTVQAYDGGDPTDITVRIHGRDANAVIDGYSQALLTDRGAFSDGRTTPLYSAEGRLEMLDLNGDQTLIVVPEPTPGETGVRGDGGWGVFHVAESGVWVYELDLDALSALYAEMEASGQSGPGLDTLTVYTLDGQAVTLSVDVTSKPSGQDPSEGDDVLIESAYIGTIDGFVPNVQNNWIDGMAGDDYLDAGAGDDEIVGGDGSDRLIGGSGADTLFGGEGDDVLFGEGDLVGTDPSVDSGDEYTGTGNDDLLFGGNGNDRLFGDFGNDLLFGDDGDDALFGGVGHDSLDGGAGNDFLFGGAGNDRLFGGAGNDRLYGGAGDDTLAGGEGDDMLEGGDGDDQLIAGAGTDILRGGDGYDTFRPANAQHDGASYALLDGGGATNTMMLGDGVETVLFSTRGGVNVVTGFDRAQDTMLIDTTVFRGLVSPMHDGRLPPSSLLTGTLDEVMAAAAGSSNRSHLMLVTLDDGRAALAYMPAGAKHPEALAVFDSVADAPTAEQIVLTRAAVGNVQEGGNAFAMGRLPLPTTGAPAFAEPAAGDLVTAYGSFTFDRVTGDWLYALNNEAAATNALRTGQQVVDTLVVHALDGTAQTIRVTIAGADEPATIVGQSAGMVIEDTVTTASGLLTVEDVDGGDNSFQTPSAADLQGAYGRFSFDAATGAWTYTLDNHSAGAQALRQHEEGREELVVHSLDGSASQTIRVFVEGRDGNAFVGGLDTRYVTQADTVEQADGSAVLRTTGHLVAFDPTQDSMVAFVPETFVPRTDDGNPLGEFSIDAQGHWSYVVDPGTLPADVDPVLSITARTVQGDTHEIRITVDLDGSGVHVPQLGEGEDVVLGTTGSDVMLVGSPSASTQDGGGGDDYLAAPAIELLGGAGNDVLVQTMDADGRVASYLDGGAGDDILIAFTHAFLAGGTGTNWLDVSQVQAGEITSVAIHGGDNTVVLGAGSDTVSLFAPGASSNLLLNFDTANDQILLSGKAPLFSEVDRLNLLLTSVASDDDLAAFAADDDQFVFVQHGTSELAQLYFFDADTSASTLLADFGAMNGMFGIENIRIIGPTGGAAG